MKDVLLKIFWLTAVLLFTPCVHATKNILVFGDSLSAGYGIPVAESWPNLLQLELEQNHPGFNIVNASISGETTSGGRQRINKALQDHHPAIVIIELGANDGLRGFRLDETRNNLSEIINTVKRSHAKVLLLGMRLPPNYGTAYTSKFQNIFPSLAKTHRIRLLPFLLDGVPAEQFQADNLHPISAAQPHIMNSVLKALRPLLN